MDDFLGDILGSKWKSPITIARSLGLATDKNITHERVGQRTALQLTSKRWKVAGVVRPVAVGMVYRNGPRFGSLCYFHFRELELTPYMSLAIVDSEYLISSSS